ncbi:hypothetical protein D3C76_1422300 [compost metagenome]
MTMPLVTSLVDEVLDELVRDHLLPPDEPPTLNRDTPIKDLPARLSSTLQNHQWKHEVRHDQPPA